MAVQDLLAILGRHLTNAKAKGVRTQRLPAGTYGNLKDCETNQNEIEHATIGYSVRIHSRPVLLVQDFGPDLHQSAESIENWIISPDFTARDVRLVSNL